MSLSSAPSRIQPCVSARSAARCSLVERTPKLRGTPDDASIGYSASHGCIRMHIPDAEWLFQHVQVVTPVIITD